MNLEFFFNLLAKVWVVAEILVTVTTTTRLGQGKIQDRGTQIILWIVIIASSWVDAWLHRVLPANMPGSLSWLRPAATGVLLVGMAVRTVAIITLGRAFSANVALLEGQRLQRSGLFRLVRHPSYLGLELIFLAFALHTRTWACFAVLLVPTTLAIVYRIHVEESALRLAFGPEYEEYGRSTKRLIPGLY